MNDRVFRVLVDAVYTSGDECVASLLVYGFSAAEAFGDDVWKLVFMLLLGPIAITAIINVLEDIASTSTGQFE